jgi:hypothetical protein
VEENSLLFEFFLPIFRTWTSYTKLITGDGRAENTFMCIIYTIEYAVYGCVAHFVAHAGVWSP